MGRTMHTTPDSSDTSAGTLTRGGNVQRNDRILPFKSGDRQSHCGGVVALSLAALALTLFVSHSAQADHEASSPPIQIEVASIRIESLQNPEIQSARDLRRYYVVEFVARNVSAESAWIRWTDPYYIGDGHFQQHTCRVLLEPYASRIHGVRTKELESGEEFRFSSKYPVLTGHGRYGAEFAVAGKLPAAIAKRLRARGDNDTDRSGDVAELVRQNFKPLRVNFDLPISEDRPAPLLIELISCETRGTVKFMGPDGNRYVRPKRVKCTYRFTNQSDEPAFLLIGKDSWKGKIGWRVSLRWSDSIRFRACPMIHFVEIAAAESMTLTFTWPSLPIIEEIAYASNLSPQDAAILRTFEDKYANGEPRKWVIEHTTAVWIHHDADVMPKRVDD